MAKKKKKKLTKTQKKKLARFIISMILLFIIIIAFVFFKDKIPFFNQPSDPETSETSPSIPDSSSDESVVAKVEGITYDNLQFHFLELGVYETGDSTYIKAGDTDILIDAGASTDSVPTLIEYINKYCKDGKLEYVITTHAHADHYAGMFGKKMSTTNFNGEAITSNGIMYYYQIDTIIDFAFSTKADEDYSNTNKDIGKYTAAVNYAVSKGAKHYTAKDCWTQTNGASRTYTLDETNNITMDIIYNKYYLEKSSDENNHSVCTMFNYNDQHFFLTGDLEKEGEEALAEYYDKSTPEKTLPHCELFKAGHHGSKTSSNDCLLELITPEICTVCCCAGSSEYTNINDNTFPTQEFINRIAKYTDKVYVTSMLDTNASREANEQVFKSLNGTIIVSSDGSQIGLAASNNLTKLKDSDWFNEKIAVKVDDKDRNLICSGNKKKDYYISTDEGIVMIPRRTWPSV